MSHVQHALRIASTIACGIVIAAFAFWASDQGRSDSQAQVARVAQSDGPTTAQATLPAAPAPEPKHHGVRGAVESANERLLSPFDHIAQDAGAWPAHGVPALLALLTYGLLARILIPYLGDVRRA